MNIIYDVYNIYITSHQKPKSPPVHTYYLFTRTACPRTCQLFPSPSRTASIIGLPLTRNRPDKAWGDHAKASSANVKIVFVERLEFC